MVSAQKLHAARLDPYLQAVLEMTQAINAQRSEQELLRIFQFTLIGIVRVGRFALFTQVPGGGYQLSALYNCPASLSFEHVESLALAHTQPGPLAHPVSAIDGQVLTEAGPGIDLGFEQIVPMRHHDQYAGYLFWGGVEHREPDLLDRLGRFIQALSNVVVVAVTNRRLAHLEKERELMALQLDLAAKVQHGLFPTELPVEGPVQAYASLIPHVSVSGDFYDVMRTRKGQYLFCIADVSGKGFAAALLMANFQATLRTVVNYVDSLPDIVAELNSVIYQNAQGDRFVTGIVGLIDLTQRKISYINAGHPPGLMATASGQTMELASTCTILGAFPNLGKLCQQEIDLTEDVTILIYTDGLVEAFDAQDREYGEQRALALFSDYQGRSLREVHHALLEDLESFRGQVALHDDITMLSLRTHLFELEGNGVASGA